ncbi:glycosyltransferase family 25 protein [Amniculicola lignicola CBS 123094]|uniref:Glycosyltransferase family 25 protein n=1 Tax=Amniculicola lignicola CBS 123094 TaxID=1392246 RepID=A0A6A5WAF4_9PLEO|nr:glycosyltransferase family 25 protein [Amniculicola lignicola CBS 123094]
MSLIAARAGLKLTLIPGVTADSIHPKAMPPHIGNNNMTGTPALGVWRAHANVWKYMLDNDVESALVIEDDVDFDVNIKDIMGKLNWQLRFNNTIRWGKEVEKGWGEECPYGCDWDEIFIGSCGGKPNRDRLDLHQMYEDAHAPNVSSLPNWVRREMTTMWNLTETDGLRVISPTWSPLCTMGYGLSRMGAMRMLYQIGGWRPFGYPVDLEIAWRTAEGKLSGYTISPPAVTSWRVGGAQDSDNDAGMDASAVSSLGNIQGRSEGIKNSVRKSLAGFLEKDYWGDRARMGR